MINVFGEEEFKLIVQRGKIIPNYAVSEKGEIFSIRANKFKKLTVRTRSKKSGKGYYVMDVSTSIPVPKDLFEDYQYRVYGNPLTNKSTVEFPLRVHKAVMETWRPIDKYPPIPKEDWDKTPETAKQFIRDSAYVDHIDDDPTNNHVDNLRWVTPRQNANYVKAQEFYDSDRMEKLKQKHRDGLGV